MGNTRSRLTIICVGVSAMLRKALAITLCAMLLGAAPILSFADDNFIKAVSEGEMVHDIEILEPAIGLSKTVIVREILPISIRVHGDQKVNVSFYRLPKALEMIKSDQEEPAETDDTVTALKKDIVQSFTSVKEQALPLEPAKDEPKAAEVKSVITIRKEPVIKSERETEEDPLVKREAVIGAFKEAVSKVEEEKKLCDIAEATLNDLQGVSTDIIVSTQDQKAITAAELAYNRAVRRMETAEEAYDLALEEYQAIFQEKIFGPEPVESTGLFPYYSKVIEAIEPGMYKLVFYDDETSKILHVVSFEVTK